MSEFILQTDPLEFQNTRQSTKIAFLQQEVQQLQDHIRDLEQVVRINKEALRITSLQQTQNLTKLKNGNHNDTTASTIEHNISQNQYRNVQLLAEQLQEENLKLLEIIDKVKKERNIAQSKALISEQICEEAQRHEIEAVAELEEKIYDLRKLLQDKEYAIQELEKLKLVPEQEGVLIKFREVLNPTEQGLKLHNEIDSLNGMLAKLSKELNKIRTEKQEIMAINYSLTSELMKIRATISAPLNFPYKFPNFNKDDDLNRSAGEAAALFQPPMEFGDDNSDCPSPLPNKVNYPDIKHGKAPVPKLDLSQAKKIQENIANKLSQPAAQQNQGPADAKLIEKIKQLEKQLELMKKRLSHEMINNRLLSDQMSQIQREKVHLHATNEILIKSNKRYEEKAQKIYYTLEFYKDFYHKYMDLITRGHATHMKTSSTHLPNFDKLKIMNERLNSDIEPSPDQLIRGMKKLEEDDGKHVNVSVLEAKEEEEDQQNEILKEKSGNNVFEFTREQSKFFLLNLAKDLYVNTNIHKSTIAKNILRRLEFGRNNPSVKQTVRLKRSVSNPLDYVSERRKLIFEPRVHNKEKKPTKLKREKERARLADDQDIGLHKKGSKEVIANIGVQESHREADSPLKKEIPYFGAGADEMISFTVDADEFNKQKMEDVSFISNNEILDQIKNN